MDRASLAGWLAGSACGGWLRASTALVEFVLRGTTDTFNDRIYSTKRAASALPSDKNKRVSRPGRRRRAAAPGAGPERRLDADNYDERDLRRPPHPMVPV